jgi:hypothetical protein
MMRVYERAGGTVNGEKGQVELPAFLGGSWYKMRANIELNDTATLM